jgi:hypothetical protein
MLVPCVPIGPPAPVNSGVRPLLETTMAFTLEVQTEQRLSDILVVWTRALAQKGITVEFQPGLDMTGFSGVLVAKVLSAPASLTRLEVKQANAACFELWEDEDGYGFNTASGRTTVDFTLQCLCAAALAEYTNGVYVDPQMGESARGADAYRLAMAEIDYFISEPDESVFREFVDWATF